MTVRIQHELRKLRARKRREGMVMLVVAFSLLIITGIALFSVQLSFANMRFAGVMSKAYRTKWAADSYLTSGLVFIQAGPQAGNLPIETQGEVPSDPYRTVFGQPDRGTQGADDIYMLYPSTFQNKNGFPADGAGCQPMTTAYPTSGVMDYITPWEGNVIDPGWAVPYDINMVFVTEKWPEIAPGTDRYITSAYAEILTQGPQQNHQTSVISKTASVPTGELRDINDTVSIARAYYTTKH
jgi:hypothetical protein